MPRFEVQFCYTVESSVMIEAKDAKQAAVEIEKQFNNKFEVEGDEVALELTNDANVVFEILDIEPVVYCS